MPAVPVSAAGWRIEPPVSVAVAPAHRCAETAAAEGEIKQADTDLEELLKSLQSQYEAGKKAKDDTLAEKSPALALLRSVKRAKSGGAKTEL